MVEPFYYYAPQFLAGSSFKQNAPFYHSYRASRTLLNAHGIHVAVLLGGGYHQFRQHCRISGHTHDCLEIVGSGNNGCGYPHALHFTRKETLSTGKIRGGRSRGIYYLEDPQPHGEMQLETGDASQDTNGDLNEPLL